MNMWMEWMEWKGSTAPFVEQNCDWEEFLREASAPNAWLMCRGEEEEAEGGAMGMEKVLEEAILVVVVVWW